MKGVRVKVWALTALIVGLVLGALLFGGSDNQQENKKESTEKIATTWTCSMHPQIKAQEPGQCPICGMDLIPLAEHGTGDDNPMAVKMSATAAKLANIQTIVVGSGDATKSIRLNGKIVPNERLVKTQASHVDGRIEDLLVNTTGERVKQGQKLASIYSPELITAQQELLQVANIKANQPTLYKATVEKLRALKVSQNQIDEIERSGKVKEEVGIYADRSGIVLDKKVNVGDYLKKGETLFTIADLSKVWVLFDAYEGDLNFIKEGDALKFTIASIPGREFTGKIVFINPTVSTQSRVTTVRVEVSNAQGDLKPEMFAVANIEADLGASDKMILPKSAIMWTGERSVVYIQEKNTTQPSYALREVNLGTALGDAYTIEGGLASGDRVVVNGTFTVDAAAQLAGKPSMMNPEGAAVMAGHHHGEMAQTTSAKNAKESGQGMEVSETTKKEIAAVVQAYIQLKDALVTSDKELAVEIATTMKGKVEAVKMEQMAGTAHKKWMELLPALNSPLGKFESNANIDVQRKAFVRLSEKMVIMVEAFGPFEWPIYVMNCPMADNNQGAEWLSLSDEIMNPYYGDMMLKCGDVKKKID